MKVYNILFMNWFKFSFVLLLTSACVGITIFLYVTCRPSGLPFIIYCAYPTSGAMGLFILFRFCYEAVVTKRRGDEAVGSLQSRTRGYFRTLEVGEKREMMRRATALQPVYMALGEFVEITLEVSVSIWDEIIDQLLFFLSL